MRLRVIAVVMVLATTLGGCMSSGSGAPTNELVGTGTGIMGGAVLGAVVAKQLGAPPLLGALVGGVAGGVIGNRIGNALDEQERIELAAASQRAVKFGKTGQRVAWSAARGRSGRTKVAQKPSTPSSSGAQASGWVIPTTETYTKADGQTCRDLHQVAVKDGRTLETDVTACRGASGWDIPT